MSYKGVWTAGAPLGTITPTFGARIVTQPWFPSATLHKRNKQPCGGAATVLTEEIPGMSCMCPRNVAIHGHTAGKCLFQTRPLVFTMARSGHTPVLARSLNWPIPCILSIERNTEPPHIHSTAKVLFTSWMGSRQTDTWHHFSVTRGVLEHRDFGRA